MRHRYRHCERFFVCDAGIFRFMGFVAAFDLFAMRDISESGRGFRRLIWNGFQFCSAPIEFQVYEDARANMITSPGAIHVAATSHPSSVDRNYDQGLLSTPYSNSSITSGSPTVGGLESERRAPCESL